MKPNQLQPRNPNQDEIDLENLKHAAQMAAAAHKQDDELATLGMAAATAEDGSQRGQMETMPFDMIDREPAENDAALKAASIDDGDNSDGSHLNVNGDRAQNPQPKVKSANQSMPKAVIGFGVWYEWLTHIHTSNGIGQVKWFLPNKYSLLPISLVYFSVYFGTTALSASQ